MQRSCEGLLGGDRHKLRTVHLGSKLADMLRDSCLWIKFRTTWWMANADRLRFCTGAINVGSEYAQVYTQVAVKARENVALNHQSHINQHICSSRASIQCIHSACEVLK